MRAPSVRTWGALLGGVVLAAASAGCGDAVVTIAGQDDVDRGLLAHWALDESDAGHTVADSSGFGIDGTPSSSAPVPSTDVPPVHFPDPYSLSFNGADQFVAFGNPPLLNLGGPISIAAWVFPLSSDGYQDIVAHGFSPDGSQDEALRIKSGTYEFTFWNAQEHDGIATMPPSDRNNWVHLCGVFDGSSYLVYRNGKLAATTSDTTTPPAGLSAIWGIGARAPNPNDATRFFSGKIDDVRIYGRALGAADVWALYNR